LIASGDASPQLRNCRSHIEHIVVAQCGAAMLTAPLNIGVGIK
jgi:hypothetical protein